MGQDFTSMSISIISLVLSGLNIVILVYTAKRYGDVAGTIRIIQYEQEKATRARVVAIRSLINEVERIRKLVEHNSQSQPILTLPTAAFEMAFLSGQSGLISDQKLLDIATSYLTYADIVNTWINTRSGDTSNTLGITHPEVIKASLEVKRLCTDFVPPILEQLKAALQDELDKEPAPVR